MGALPQIDAPSVLPDLPGVADILFTTDLSSIAPSIPGLSQLPDVAPSYVFVFCYMLVRYINPTAERTIFIVIKI